MSDAELETPDPSAPNEVIGWYRGYCYLLLFLWLVALPLLMIAMVAAEQSSTPGLGSINVPEIAPAVRSLEEAHREQQNARMVGMGITGLLAGLVCSLPVFIALRLRPTPGAWAYHIFILCLGLSGCTLPFSVLLLIQWFQPRTQAHFGRGPLAPRTGWEV